MTTMTYDVTVRKTVVMTQVVRVQATSKKQAENLAQEAASDVNADTKTVGWRAQPETVTPVVEALVAAVTATDLPAKVGLPIVTALDQAVAEILTAKDEPKPKTKKQKAAALVVEAQERAASKRKAEAPKPGRQVVIEGQMVELTALEAETLDELINNALSCSGGDFFILEESTPRNKEKAMAFGGLVTALQNKGAIYVYEPTYTNDDGRQLKSNRVTQGTIKVDNWKDGGAQ